MSAPGLAMRVGALLPTEDQTLRDRRLRKQRWDQVAAASLISLSFASEIEIVFEFGLRERLLYVWTLLSEHMIMGKELYDPGTRLASKKRREPVGAQTSP